MIYVLLGILILIEIISGIEVVKSVNRFCDSKRLDERTNDMDSDIRVYVPSRDRDRSGNQSDYLGLDDEAVKNILMGMRMSTRYCDTERLAIDYCIDKLEGGEDE